MGASGAYLKDSLEKLTVLTIDDSGCSNDDAHVDLRNKSRAKTEIKNIYRIDDDENYANEWKTRCENSLPKYVSLCREVYRELSSRWCDKFCRFCEKGCMSRESNRTGDYYGNIIMFILVKLLQYFASFLSYGFPIGHLFTEIGIVYWYVVVEKLFIFCLVCSGVWFDQCLEAYDLEQIANAMKFDNNRSGVQEDKYASEFVLSRLKKWHDQFKSRDLWKCFIRVRDESDDDIEGRTQRADIVKAVVGPRTVCIMLASQLTFWSIYALGTVAYHLFPLSKKAKKLFQHPYIDLEEAREIALQDEKQYIKSEEPMKWSIQLKSYVQYLKQNRLAQWFYHLFQFGLTLGILYDNISFGLHSALLSYFPLYLSSYWKFM